MSREIESLLTIGLQAGFAGGTEIGKVIRGGSTFKYSHFINEVGIYHDEWFADRAGGGQEIVTVGDKSLTRVYAGGTIPEERLSELGISVGEVMSFLKKQILQNGENIRLYTNFIPDAEGDWQYSYTVLDRDPEIPLTVGKEAIKFKGELVFVHNFIISPVD